MSVAFDSMFDMTLADETATPTAGTASSVHPAMVALGEAIARVSLAADSALWGLSDDELTDAVGQCEQLRAGAHAYQLALVCEVDGRDLGRRSGAASTAAWLTGRFRIRPGQARSWVKLANSIAERSDVTDYAANVSGPRPGRELLETGNALAAGRISPEHAEVVGKIMDKVPRSIEAERAGQAEADLAGYCREFDPATVAKLGDYMVELMREDALDDEENDRYRRRDLRLNDDSGGISGQLTREGMALLRSALDPLATPNPADDGTPDERTAGQRLADALVELARRAIASDEFAANHGLSHRVMVSIGLDSLIGPCADHDGGRERSEDLDDSAPAAGDRDGTGVSPGEGDRATASPAASGPGAGDPAAGGHAMSGPAANNGAGSGPAANDGAASGTSGAQRADEEAGEHAGGPADPTSAAGGLEGEPSAGGTFPRWAAWRDGAAPAQQEWGSLISASAARRLACHASVQRIVLDPAGAVLDVGRDYRTATAAQFAALIARDGGCAFPGCTRPPAWCIAHHAKHWINGGETDLDNLVLLCGYHHRVIHHGGWDVMISTGDRLPTFYPPRWVDPDQGPRRNKRLRFSLPDP